MYIYLGNSTLRICSSIPSYSLFLRCDCANMNHQLPRNFRVASGENEIGQSSRNDISYDLHVSCVTNKPNSWSQTFRSLETVTSEVDDFQDVFRILTDLQPSSVSSAQANDSIPSRLGICCQPDKRQSSGTIRKHEEIVRRNCQSYATEISEELNRKKNERPRKARSAEVHNLSERNRRDRINKKFKTLQESVPNCSKSDRASVLDDAINYVKTLRHQVAMMCAGGGAVFQAPYMSPGGIQDTQIPQFSQFVPIRPNFGRVIGCGSGKCSSTGLPMLSVSAARLHHTLAAGVGLSQLSSPRNLAVPQMRKPIAHSQQFPASVDTSGMIPNFVPGFSPAFSFSGLVPSSAREDQLAQISQADPAKLEPQAKAPAQSAFELPIDLLAGQCFNSSFSLNFSFTLDCQKHPGFTTSLPNCSLCNTDFTCSSVLSINSGFD